MFDQTFVNTQAQTRRPWTVAISLALQTALVAIALIAPLLHVASLDVSPRVPIHLPFRNVDLNVKPEIKPSQHPLSETPRPVFTLAPWRASVTVPQNIDPTPDAPEIPGNAPMAPSFSGLPTGIVTAQPPPPPNPIVQSTPSAHPAPIVIGGAVQAAKLRFAPKPAYPPLARTTRTEGTVRIQAVIARNGAIRNLQILSGPPLLVAAAIEAVQQWRYQPTLLNGEPVEVITEINVNFTLAGF